MKTIAEFEMSQAPGKDQFILMDPKSDIAVALIHEDFLTDFTRQYNVHLIERLEKGETVEVVWIESQELEKLRSRN